MTFFASSSFFYRLFLDTKLSNQGEIDPEDFQIILSRYLIFLFPSLLLVTKFSNRGGTARGFSRNLLEVSHGIPLLLDTKFSNRGGIGQEDLGFQEKICKYLIFIPFSWTRNFEIERE